MKSSKTPLKLTATTMIMVSTALLSACGGSSPSQSHNTTPTSTTVETSTPKQAQATLSLPSNGKVQWHLPTKDAAFTLKDSAGSMISSSNLTCTSKVTSAITISSDCKAIVGLRLGKHEVIVNGSGYTATATVTVIPQVKTLASQGAGALYHLVVTPTGNLLAWGRNYFASLGQGADSQDSYLPIYVKNTAGTDKLANIVSASTGADTALALTEEGEVFFWGGSNNPTRPSYIRNAANTGNLKNIVQVSAGHSNFAALADDGTVYTWGYNHGQGVDNFSQYPKQVINANNAGVLNNIVSISAGKGFTLALSADGKVHAWGFNASGETGRGTTATPALSATPVQKASLQTDLSNVVAISAGYNFSLALTADGKVYAWGENNHGQIGQNVQYKLWSRAVPVMNPLGVGELSNIKMIAAGGGHALAMDKEANIVSWGYGPDGALGDGANRPAGNQWLIPHNVVNAAGIGLLSGAISISTGNANSLAVMPDGSLLIWGQGFGGANAQGINNTKNLAVPTQVKDMAGTGFLSLGPISTYQNWLHYGL